VYIQPTKLSEGGSTIGLLPGGYVHSEAQVPCNLSVMACHTFERIQGDFLCVSENVIS